MKIKVLTNSGSFPSAKLLRDALQNISEQSKIWVTKFPDTVESSVTHLVRYGNPSPVNVNLTGEINTPSWIFNCSKLNFSKVARSENKYYDTLVFTRCSTIPAEFPVVVRQDMYSFGAKGIVIAHDEEEFKKANGVYWSPFIKTSSEYRVHIFGGEILRVFKKVPMENFVEPDEPIRNSKNYNYSLRTNMTNFGTLVSAVAHLGTIFGTGGFMGLDVGFNSKTGKYIFFEANTAPGLNTVTASMLAEKILEYFSEE